jgi:hypothetical protein
MKLRSRNGQAALEYALIYAGVLLPLTFMTIFTAELLWVWHSVNEFTREGARYAATHCWQADGENVRQYMRTNVPRVIDMDQIRELIEIEYYGRNPDSGQMEAFACSGGECSAECVPDAVTVSVRNYEFRRFMGFLGLPPVAIPDFRTTATIESAGCDETGTCVP